MKLSNILIAGIRLTEKETIHLCLTEIENMLQANRRSLRDFPSMPYPIGYARNQHHNNLIHNEMAYDKEMLAEQYNTTYQLLTVYFLYGYGGTGKTFFWTTLSSGIRSNGGIVCTVASSGIASLLLPGGRTAHSKFAIPVPATENSTCNIHQGSELAELLKVTKLIVWDEAPMCHEFAFEALDKSLKDIMQKNLPFGGNIMVFGGDFRQILPIVPKGDGKIGQYNDGFSEITIPDEFLIKNYDDPIHAIVEATYPSLINNYSDTDYLQKRVVLASKKEIVDKINDYVLSLIPNHEKEYCSADSIDKSDELLNPAFALLPPEFLYALQTSGTPNHKLKLKVGTPIMLLRNLDQTDGLCNRTRLIITKLGSNVIEAEVITGPNSGNRTYIPRINMSPSESPWPFKLIRRQFPFIVSYAMTINKSQGQSLHHIGLYFPHPVFSHGQLYVVLSRVKSKDGLHILIHDNDVPGVLDQPSTFPRDPMDNIRFTAPFIVQKNLLQVPFSYHRQWLRNYPKYVLFHYDGEIHFIRVKTLGTKCFFADGLNDFRRAHNLNESMILRLVAGDKNTIFTVHIDGPAHHHSSLKPIIYRRRYIFTNDMLQQNLPLTLPAAASKFVYGSKKSITIHHRLSKSTKWPLTIQHDIPAITQPWFNLIHEKNLRPGDEVVFYYRFHDHAWELLIRKAIEWNNNNTDLDFDE
ncbi:ATP-dependent DNA helicase PIF1 [Glycine soja]|uniref:ATP-dependent DNA helicase n=1 Tax=Glycine soja TaxID=3848 RepID=A0A445M2J6_GLYSO|nr:ATP-dependent DNA helicase PIF1 [Glycine soja]